MQAHKLLFILTGFLFYCLSPQAGNKTEIPLKYDITSAGVGAEGTFLIKVSVYQPKVIKADDILKKAAIHGVIFKGVSAGQGKQAQRPLASSLSIEKEKAEFFNEFFKENGTFLNYATLIEGSLEIVKSGKKEYKISAILSVQKDQLRKDLEKAKVITGFSDMF